MFNNRLGYRDYHLIFLDVFLPPLAFWWPYCDALAPLKRMPVYRLTGMVKSGAALLSAEPAILKDHNVRTSR